MNTGRRFLMISSLLFFVSILLLLSSCSLLQNKRVIVADTPSTDLSEENIDGIFLGTNIKESNFIKGFKIKNDGLNSYNLDNDKYGILTNNEKEITFITGNETIKTGKGVNHGDSINQVIKKYGKNYYEYTVQGVQTIGYVDHKNKCKIDFWYVNNKVIDITLSNEDVDPIL
ncbi:hypothetical protein KUV80_03940 [Fictibacillus nanhaiensis]|uniref:hypothetical protein n=1 Tax=Fictibacillus nanhaiensis TaxID=742169 RepID=UPI001C96F27A|nr:hypothetical protein [Fictibacillus nanhaiensis]MBY6035785.1 hypothetical protein [Fictibacillus nanhaiensis]